MSLDLEALEGLINDYFKFNTSAVLTPSAIQLNIAVNYQGLIPFLCSGFIMPCPLISCLFSREIEECMVEIDSSELFHTSSLQSRSTHPGRGGVPAHIFEQTSTTTIDISLLFTPFFQSVCYIFSIGLAQQSQYIVGC